MSVQPSPATTRKRDSLSWQVILIPSLICLAVLLGLLFLPAAFGWPPNDPYRPGETSKNVLFSNFVDPPKTLDPAVSYYTDEASFLGSIVEPPFQYDYLKRPQGLIPDACTKIPDPVYLDKDGKPLPADAPDDQVVQVAYTFEVRQGMMYQPHPCFAQENGQYLYHNLKADGITLDGIDDINDPFFKTGTREVTADDFVNEIRRMGDPRLAQACPVGDRWCELIVGFKEYMDAANAAYQAEAAHQKSLPDGVVVKSIYHRVLIPMDLSKIPLTGVTLVDRYHFKIVLKQKYPEIISWMALFFFAPVPHEAEQFYYQPACVDHALSFKRFPVGAGPFYITKYDPAFEIRLGRNPNYLQWQTYPGEGEADDQADGLLKRAGQKLPFLDGARYMVERESLPSWNKFQQGYYDSSGISKESFDKVIKVDQSGFNLSSEFREKGIRLAVTQILGVHYFGFNMRDPQIGQVDEKTIPDAAQRDAENERHRKLRLAIAIAMDYHEYVQIFLNGRAMVANNPLPPGMFGYHYGKEGINPYTETWDEKTQKAVHRPIEDARKLLAEAGYPNGIDSKSGKQLALTYDNTATSAADQFLVLWYRKQFEKLGIQLQSSTTDEAGYDEKIRKGQCQIINMGWYADYPDPENFLFLLISKEAVVDSGGENRCNYSNSKYDELFIKMKAMANSPERQKIIDEMVEIVRHDSPWVFEVYPQAFGLKHRWIHDDKPQPIGYNGLKYISIDGPAREKAQLEWNAPHYGWPLLVIALLFLPIFGYVLLRPKS